MPDEEWDADRRLAHEKAVESDETVGPDGRGDSASGSELTLTCSVYRRRSRPGPVFRRTLRADPARATIAPAGFFKSAQSWETIFTIVQQLSNEHANIPFACIQRDSGFG